MPLRFVLDENLPARIQHALERHNLSSESPVDFVCVGDPANLPLGSDDRTILLWCEREERILLTEDKSTMPAHLAAHLEAGHGSPGIFSIRPGTSASALIEFLVLAAHASEPEEWQDRIEYVP